MKTLWRKCELPDDFTVRELFRAFGYRLLFLSIIGAPVVVVMVIYAAVMR